MKHFLRNHPPGKPQAATFATFRSEWLLLAGALLLIGGLTAYDLHNEYRAIEARERERLAGQTQVIHDNLARQLDAVNRALLNIRTEWPASRLGDRAAMASATPRLKAFVDAMPGVRSLFILDASGTVRATSFPQLLGRNFRERSYFQAALKNPQRDTLYLSPPFRTALGAWAINLVRMIPGPRGEFAGVVAATLDPQEFRLVLRSINYAPDMWSAMAHGDGQLFLVEPDQPAQLGMNLARPGAFFTRFMASGATASVMRGRVYQTGDDRLLAQHRIQPPALNMDRPLVVAAGRELPALYAPWRRDLLTSGGLFGLLVLASASALYLLQRRKLRTQEQVAQADAALREKTEELQHYFDVALNLLCIASIEGRFVKLNPAWEQLLGYPLTQLEGMSVFELLHPLDQDAARSALQRLAQGHKIVGFTCRCRHRDGSYRELEWQAVPHGTLVYADARDVTQARHDQQALLALNARLQAQRETLHSLAFVDGLTGVANRRRFDDSLQTEWRQGLRNRTPLALLMLDIDHFKAYNDHAGHQAGDASLRSVAQTLRERLGRPHDLLARYGGEEFVCLLPGTDLAGAQAKAEELRRAVQALGIPHPQSPTAPVITLSIGVVSHIPGEDGSPEQLLQAADTALYVAKSSGRNRVCVPPG